MGYVNRKVTLAQRPSGMPVDADFSIVDDNIECAEAGQVVVQVDTLSIDAFIRTVMDEGSYHRSARIGGTIPALGVGRVAESSVDGYAVGDHVSGPLGAQTVACVPAAALRKLDVSSVRPEAYLGVLGRTTGVTAYFGIVEVGKVAPTDVVVVSGAAGAVGSMAGQVAKLVGSRQVIGIAGGPAKVAYLVDELGFDAAIDHRHDDVAARLRELAPSGVDVFFDNVGGELLDVVLAQIVEFSRVVLCGAVSQYDHMSDVRGPKNYLKLAERHARMEGFTVGHFEPQFAQAERVLARWLADDELVMREHVEHGIDSFPSTLRLLLNGGHYGKLLLQLTG